MAYGAELGGIGPLDQTGAVCLWNIGPRERRRRMAFGVVLLAVGVVGTLPLALTGAAWWLRLALFLLFWGGALGFFQAWEKT